MAPAVGPRWSVRGVMAVFASLELTAPSLLLTSRYLLRHTMLSSGWRVYVVGSKPLKTLIPSNTAPLTAAYMFQRFRIQRYRWRVSPFGGAGQTIGGAGSNPKNESW